MSTVERQQRHHVEQTDEHIDPGEREQDAGQTGFLADRRAQPTDSVHSDGLRRLILVHAGEVLVDVDRIHHLDHATDAGPCDTAEIGETTREGRAQGLLHEVGLLPGFHTEIGGAVERRIRIGAERR